MKGVTSMRYIKQFQEITKEDSSIVGGKGANLGELFRQGLPVPNGFCITTNAFDEYMKQNNINPQSFPSNALHKKIDDGILWEELKEEIASCYTSLGACQSVAVRSSATAEDQADASFAGQQETFLNVVGIEALYLAVKKCFASLYSSRAIAYRKQTNYTNAKLSLSVVVQVMVESEISGVLFTADPISQSIDQMMLNASWGLGEAIVSGKVTPDIYIYDKKKKRIIDKKIGEKHILMQYALVGIEEKETTSLQKEQFCLSQKHALEVFEMGAKVEHHYGSPQDIEWAFYKDELYLLQSRPITTSFQKQTKTNKLSASQKKVLDNWIEHCPSPLYPLDVEPCEIIDQAKGRVFEELGIHIGSELKMEEDGILSLSAGTVQVSFEILKIPFLFSHFTDYTINATTTEKEFDRIRRTLQQHSLLTVSKLSVNDLIANVKELINLSYDIAYVRFRYNIFPSIARSKLLYPTLRRIDKNLNEFDLLSNLSYKTWEMNLSLNRLVQAMLDNQPLYEYIKNESITDTFISVICKEYPEFSNKIDVFLKEFGWKSTSSYCAFSAVSWQEDRTLLYSLLKVLLHSTKQSSEQDKYQTILSNTRNIYSEKKATLVKKKMEEIRQYHVNREESLYLIEMCYGLARRNVFELETRFPEILIHPQDILYLTLQEVYSLPSHSPQYKEKIAKRKAARPENERLWNVLSFGEDIENNANIITGISGNHGMCKGTVRRILSIQEFDKMQPGDILVCRYTDPSWTPLFVLASAVVSDTGGPLSHSAIVAREYNIPAVLGCKHATSLLQDGQEIMVNGDKGIVQILS